MNAIPGMGFILPDGTRLDASGSGIAFRVMCDAIGTTPEESIIPIADLIGRSERCTPS